MTVQSDRSFDPSVNLVMGNIAVDNPANPTLVRVSIKASKTDPFRKGVSIFLGRTYNDICQLQHSTHTWLPKASKVPVLCSVSKTAATSHISVSWSM